MVLKPKKFKQLPYKLLNDRKLYSQRLIIQVKLRKITLLSSRNHVKKSLFIRKTKNSKNLNKKVRAPSALKK